MKWQMHIAGPDDIEVYDDELTALRDANKINIRYVRDRQANPGAEVLCVGRSCHSSTATTRRTVMQIQIDEKLLVRELAAALVNAGLTLRYRDGHVVLTRAPLPISARGIGYLDQERSSDDASKS